MEQIPVVSLRLVREKTVPYHGRKVNDAQGAFDLFRELIGDLDREAVWIACLDVRNQLTCLSQISVGSLAETQIHPREVFKVVLLANAQSVIVLHNHPSGDSTPSTADWEMTSQLSAAAQLLGIKFLDHIIIGDGRYYSFASVGGLS